MPSTIASPPKNSTGAPISAMVEAIGTPCRSRPAAKADSAVSLPKPLTTKMPPSMTRPSASNASRHSNAAVWRARAGVNAVDGPKPLDIASSPSPKDGPNVAPTYAGEGSEERPSSSRSAHDCASGRRNFVSISYSFAGRRPPPSPSPLLDAVLLQDRLQPRLQLLLEGGHARQHGLGKVGHDQGYLRERLGAERRLVERRELAQLLGGEVFRVDLRHVLHRIEHELLRRVLELGAQLRAGGGVDLRAERALDLRPHLRDHVAHHRPHQVWRHDRHQFLCRRDRVG